VYGDTVQLNSRVEYDWTSLDIDKLSRLSQQLPNGYHIRHHDLATALAATFIVHCLERGIIPHWSTRNNPVSDHLAEKLGYVRSYEYEVLSIPNIKG
jgi:hypothetical protein